MTDRPTYLRTVGPDEAARLIGQGGLIEDTRSPAQREADLGAQYRAAGRQMAQDWLGLIDQLHEACNRVYGAESLPEGVRDLADKLRRPLIAAGLNATAILERAK